MFDQPNIISIPDTVTSIGKGAFVSCNALPSIHLPEGITTIGSSAFNTLSAMSPDPNTQHYRMGFIILPSTLTTIGGGAFLFCRALSTVSLPRAVTTIGTAAFRECDNISTVYYGGTRAQIVTFLWRAKGCPEATSTDNPFNDIKESEYYYKAVLWAVENKITAGTSSVTFSPNATCTRGQIVSFLYRYYVPTVKN